MHPIQRDHAMVLVLGCQEPDIPVAPVQFIVQIRLQVTDPVVNREAMLWDDCEDAIVSLVFNFRPNEVIVIL
jgi:hypothetical protein